MKQPIEPATPHEAKPRQVVYWLLVAIGVVTSLLASIVFIYVLFFSRPSLEEQYLLIKPGMSREEIEAVLGRPDAESHLEERPPMLFIDGAPERDMCDYGTGSKRIRVAYALDTAWKIFLLDFSEDAENPKLIDSR